MNIAICEDETYSSCILKRLVAEVLEEHDIISNIDLFVSGEQLLSSDNKYNIMFIDCKLPGINGVDAAKLIKQRNRDVCIVFVSAFPEYSIVGYEASAFRFLVKPVDKAKLTNTIDAYIEESAEQCKISFKSGTKEVVISSGEILYIESVGQKSIVRLSNNSFETRKSLDAFENEISDPHYYRTHRRYIVNISYISEFSGNSIKMSNGETAELSLRKVSSFSKIYNAYLKKEV